MPITPIFLRDKGIRGRVVGGDPGDFLGLKSYFPKYKRMPELDASLTSFISRLPKVELHLHLEGTILPSTLVELSARHDVRPLTLPEAEALYCFTDFTGFLESFKAVTRLLLGPDDYELAAWRMIEHLAEPMGEREILELLQIGAGTEVPTGAADDEASGTRVGRRGQRGIESFEGLEVDRVATLGPVDRDGGDSTLDRVVDRHAGSALVDDRDEVAFLDHLTGFDVELAHDTGCLGDHGDLHLHRLEDADLVALGDHLSLFGDDLPHVRRDLRPNLSHRATLPGAPLRWRRYDPAP